MIHLSVDEILNFVSLTELNKEAIELSATVNGHIRKCEKCLKVVRAFQLIYDEFSALDRSGDFRGFIFDKFPDVKNENIKTEDILNAIDEFDDFR